MGITKQKDCHNTKKIIIWIVGIMISRRSGYGRFFFAICVIWHDTSSQKYGLSQTLLSTGTRGGVDFLWSDQHYDKKSSQ